MSPKKILNAVPIGRKSNDYALGTFQQIKRSLERLEIVMDEENKKYKIAYKIELNDVSGGSVAEEEQIKKLVSDIQSNKVDIIVSDDIDRLHRDTEFGLNLFKMCEYYGIRILCVNDEFDSLRVGAKKEYVSKSAYSEEYRLDIGIKSSRALHTLFKDGYATGRPAFGYKNVPEDSGMKKKDGTPLYFKRIEINDEEAKVINDIFKLYSDGTNPIEIAKGLNESQVQVPKSSGSRYWTKRLVKIIISNEKYIGEWYYNRLKLVKFNGKMKLKEKPKEQTLYEHREHLRIIKQELWNEVHSLYDKRRKKYYPVKRGRPGGLYSKTLWTGFLSCNLCGGTFVATSNQFDKKTKGKVYVYGCSNSINGKLCKNKLRIKEYQLRPILNKIREQVCSMKYLKRIAKEIDKIQEEYISRSDYKKDIRKVATLIKDIDKKLDNKNTAIEYAKDKTTIKRLTEETDKLNEEKRIVEDNLKNLQSKGSEIVKFNWNKLFKERTLIEWDDTNEIRRLFESIIVKIIIAPTKNGKYLIGGVLNITGEREKLDIKPLLIKAKTKGEKEYAELKGFLDEYKDLDFKKKVLNFLKQYKMHNTSE